MTSWAKSSILLDMETTTNPEAKEATMFGYEIRIDFSDGTFDIFTVEAHSVAEAFELLGTVEGMTGTRLLAIIDRQPAVCLAW